MTTPLTLPIAGVNTGNLDAAGDRPDQARADLLDLANKVNKILAALSGAAEAGAIAVRDNSGNLSGSTEKLGGKSWVNIVTANHIFTGVDPDWINIPLRSSGAHHFYRVSVFVLSTTGGPGFTIVEGYDPYNSYYRIVRPTTGDSDYLSIYALTASQVVYTVDVWE